MKRYFSIFLLAALLVGCKTSKVAVTPNISSPSEIKKTSDFIQAMGAKLAGNESKAVALFEQCVKTDSLNDAAWYELSKLYSSDYKLKEAKRAATIAADIDDTNVDYLINLASLSKTIPASKELVSLYEKIVTLAPENLELQFEYANALLTTSDYKKTLKQLYFLEDAIGISEDITVKTVKIYEEKGQTGNAVKEMEKLIAAYPEETRYISMLANMYMKYGDEDAAMECYGNIAKESPDDPYIHITLSEYYRKKSDTQRAYEELLAGFAVPSLDAESKLVILFKLYKTEDLNIINGEAFNLLKTISETHPDSFMPLAILSESYYFQQNFGMARQGFYKALTMNNKSESIIPVYEKLVHIESYLDNTDSVEVLCARAEKIAPLEPYFYFYDGVNKLLLKKYSEALGKFNEGITLVINNDPFKAEFFSYIGECYYKLGDTVAAYNSYDKSLALNPDNAFLLNNYSYYLSTSGVNLEKAETMGRKAVELDPENPYNLDTYGWALFKNGKYDEALKYTTDALSKVKEGDNKSTYLEHIGDIEWKLGNEENAAKYWENALKAAGDKKSDILIKKALEKTYYE
ncbi:MAG: tetratricopeptide repeat protein [Bacteroidales bacterium]|nr:tetratricopeptide repeat protein [Bacteroidales bacterium]